MNYLLASLVTFFCVEHKPKDPLFEDQYTREKLIAIIYPAKHHWRNGYFVNIKFLWNKRGNGQGLSLYEGTSQTYMHFFS